MAGLTSSLLKQFENSSRYYDSYKERASEYEIGLQDESIACSLYLLMHGGTKQAPMPTVSREVDVSDLGGSLYPLPSGT